MHWCRRKIRQHFAQQARDTLQLHPPADRGAGGRRKGGHGGERGWRRGGGAIKTAKDYTANVCRNHTFCNLVIMQWLTTLFYTGKIF